MKPSHRKLMVREVVSTRNISIRTACRLFGISKSCYRYQPQLNEENDVIADWLILITDSQRNWGFGLCSLYLRNVKDFRFNHKGVYRIYCEISLNMRINPKNGLNMINLNHWQYLKAATNAGRWTSCTISCRMAVLCGC